MFSWLTGGEESRDESSEAAAAVAGTPGESAADAASGDAATAQAAAAGTAPAAATSEAEKESGAADGSAAAGTGAADVAGAAASAEAAPEAPEADAAAMTDVAASVPAAETQAGDQDVPMTNADGVGDVHMSSAEEAVSAEQPPSEDVGPAGHGTLTVKSFAGFDLYQADSGFLGDVSDPYVVCRVGDSEQRTTTIKNNLNPVWKDEEFTFQVDSSNPSQQLLQLKVMDANNFRSDVFLGSLEIDIFTLARGQATRIRQKLKDINTGEIEFEICLQPEQAASGTSSAGPGVTAVEPAGVEATASGTTSAAPGDTAAEPASVEAAASGTSSTAPVVTTAEPAGVEAAPAETVGAGEKQAAGDEETAASTTTPPAIAISEEHHAPSDFLRWRMQRDAADVAPSSFLQFEMKKRRAVAEANVEADSSMAPGVAVQSTTPAVASPIDSSSAVKSGDPVQPAAVHFEPPPEGVDWANRWAEIENTMRHLEDERDALKLENTRLNEKCLAQAVAAKQQAQMPLPDTEELQKLREDHSKSSTLAESRMNDVVAERNKCARLSQELQSKISDLAKLSTEKFQAQYEKSVAESELLPLREERDRLIFERRERDKLIDELRNENSVLADEKNKLFLDKARVQRELAGERDSARADAQFQSQEAEKARDGERTAQNEAADAKQSLRECRESCDDELACQEAKYKLQREQLDREHELRESAQKQISEFKSSRDASEKALHNANAEMARLHVKVDELQKALNTLETEHEELLRKHVQVTEAAAAETGAEDADASLEDMLPGEFPSLTALVREVTTSRSEILKLKQDKEQLQEVLADVEREVRARYPALLSQREEVERLRRVANQLTHQNEGLLANVQSAERGHREAGLHAKQKERSAQILEAHARDMARQLAVLVHENRKLTGQAPALLPGSDLQALEEDRKAFRSVQDLTEQNESLRKSVARLTEECETAAQRELKEMREEHNQQVERWQQHLEEKGEHLKALVDTNKRLTEERDDAQRKLKEKQVAASQAGAPADGAEGDAPADGSGQHRELVPAKHLQTVREEFTKFSDHMRKENKEARESELKAREELAETRGRHRSETSRADRAEMQLGDSTKQLEEKRSKIEALERRLAALEDKSRREEELVHELEAQLGQMRRDKDLVEMQLKLERSKAEGLENKNNSLLAQKATTEQRMLDIQGRMLQEADGYKKMKDDLEESYKSREDLLREQVSLAEQRHGDLQQTVREITAARIERETQAADARTQLAQVEGSRVLLEKQIVEIKYELDQHRAEAARKTRRGAEVAAEAEEQLRQSVAAREKDPEIVKLEKQLKFAEDREQRLTKDAEIWEDLIKKHQSELAKKKEQVEELENDLTAARERHDKHQEELANSKKRELATEERSQQHARENGTLRDQLDKAQLEIEKARIEQEEKLRQALNRADISENEMAIARKEAEKHKEKHHETLGSHDQKVKQIEEANERYRLLEEKARDLSKSNGDLKALCERLRTERAGEVKDLRQRAEMAEEHNKLMAAESKKYQEQLYAVVSHPGGDATEAEERIAKELRLSREIGEKKRQELELDRARLERESKRLKDESRELHKRLDDEHQRVLQLQAQVNRENRASVKLGQLGLVEDENRRLNEEIKSFQSRLEDTQSRLEAEQRVTEPLQRNNRDLKLKEEQWDNVKRSLSVQIEEWKALYNDAVHKFDQIDHNEHKRLREESVKWAGEKSNFIKQIQKSEEDLKKTTDDLRKRGEDLAQADALKKQHDDLQSKALQLTRQNSQLNEANSKKEQQLKDMDSKLNAEVQQRKSWESMKDLWSKKRDQQEAQIQKLSEDHRKVSDDKVAALKRAEDEKSAALSKVHEEKSSLLQKAQGELAAVKQKCDKALGFAMDYQRACEALMNKNTGLENDSKAANKRLQAHEEQLKNATEQLKATQDKLREFEEREREREREARQRAEREEREARERAEQAEREAAAREQEERAAREAKEQEAREQEAREREAREREQRAPPQTAASLAAPVGAPAATESGAPTSSLEAAPSVSSSAPASAPAGISGAIGGFLHSLPNPFSTGSATAAALFSHEPPAASPPTNPVSVGGNTASAIFSAAPVGSSSTAGSAQPTPMAVDPPKASQPAPAPPSVKASATTSVTSAATAASTATGPSGSTVTAGAVGVTAGAAGSAMKRKISSSAVSTAGASSTGTSATMSSGADSGPAKVARMSPGSSSGAAAVQAQDAGAVAPAAMTAAATVAEVSHATEPAAKRAPAAAKKSGAGAATASSTGTGAAGARTASTSATGSSVSPAGGTPRPAGRSSAVPPGGASSTAVASGPSAVPPVTPSAAAPPTAPGQASQAASGAGSAATGGTAAAPVASAEVVDLEEGGSGSAGADVN